MLAQRRFIIDQEDARLRQGRCGELFVVHLDRKSASMGGSVGGLRKPSTVAAKLLHTGPSIAAPHARLGDRASEINKISILRDLG